VVSQLSQLFFGGYMGISVGIFQGLRFQLTEQKN
jgi:hypothetical protein